ncbi:Lactoylglutathione lyase [Phaeobacter piscinae]|uniref:Lactoylglutathione lyase n=1 Tax=Phaeobacter piscinae TaxID=1580596 RepID=A0AAN1GPQ0_9RHOB|nr:VOC family protein [Phaeobacter piscinae]ATG42878.1 Lactoylglutathione lyase [Phaeobacter piscinae]AUR35196.1 Lactoylglutathione lyase [Phaeobacter piscinae]
MEKAQGIGGVFFRAKDPEALSRWYNDHLGIDPVGGTPWMQGGGYTVFAPFAEDTDYFGDSSKQWMINFRVTDLAAMIAQLQAADISVETRPEWDGEIGYFARLHDPEGNPIELWQPIGRAADTA